MVGVGVGADEQTDQVNPEVDLPQRALELRDRPGLVHAAVTEHASVGRGKRPSVAVRHTRPRQGKAQAPDARQYLFAAAQLAGSGRFSHNGFQPTDQSPRARLGR